MIIFIIVLVIALAVAVIDNLSKRKQISNAPIANEPDNEPVDQPLDITEALHYKRKLLLTKNEWAFYKSLKPVADELGYSVLAKIRVADLVDVNVDDKKDYMKYFNKVNRKHIDFVLAKPENLQIELLIELDDGSHDSKQKPRDEFIDALYKQTGYKFLRVRGAAGIKEKIEDLLAVKLSNAALSNADAAKNASVSAEAKQ